MIQMAVETFEKYLNENKIEDINILISDQPTHTAVAAAEVHGVEVSNIVKSLIIEGDNRFIMVLVPGDKRLDLEALSTSLKEQFKMSTPDDAKRVSGYSIGGVPPFGHKTKFVTYIINGFNTDYELVAAAGSSNGVFKISYERLVELTDAKLLDI